VARAIRPCNALPSASRTIKHYRSSFGSGASTVHGGGKRRLASPPPRPPPAALFLSLAAYCRCSRVLHFHPTVGAPGAVGRAEALRDDTLAAKRADVLEHDRALAAVVLVENDASCGSRSSVASAALRCSTGVRRRSSPSNSIRSKAQSTAAESCR
jgi:hypothetical protein